MKKIILGLAVFAIIFGSLVFVRMNSGGDKTVFELGKISDFPPGSIQVIAPAKAVVIADNEGIYAFSATCTHKGCLIRKENQGLICPCHAAQFDLNGKVLRGPAKNDLVWYSVKKNLKGNLILDISRPVAVGVKLRINQ